MSDPHPFRAKYESECADSVPAHKIHIGDLIIKRPRPSVFEYTGREGPRSKVVKLYYSHVQCYQDGQKRLREILDGLQKVKEHEL